MSLAGNVGVAVKNVFPPCVELKILYMLYIVHKLYLLLPVLAAILVIWLVLDLLCFHHLSYSGKVTEAFPFTPSGYEMASKIVAGVYISTTNSRSYNSAVLKLSLLPTHPNSFFSFSVGNLLISY